MCLDGVPVLFWERMIARRAVKYTFVEPFQSCENWITIRRCYVSRRNPMESPLLPAYSILQCAQPTGARPRDTPHRFHSVHVRQITLYQSLYSDVYARKYRARYLRRCFSAFLITTCIRVVIVTRQLFSVKIKQNRRPRRVKGPACIFIKFSYFEVISCGFFPQCHTPHPSPISY